MINKLVKLLLVYVSCIFGILSWNSCKENGINQQKSKVSITPEKFDVGGIPNSESKFAKFRIQNNFDEPIRITKTDPSCGCTSISIENPIVKARQSAFIIAQMSNHGRMGKFGATIDVEWETQSKLNKGSSLLRVEANAEQLAILNPTSLNFGSVKKWAPEQRMQVYVLPGNVANAWTRVKVKTKSKFISVENERVTDHWEGTIKIEPSRLPIGIYRDNLIFELENSRKEVVTTRLAQVSIKVEGPIKVKPSTLFLGNLKQRSMALKGTLLLSSQLGGFHITNVSASMPFTFDIQHNSIEDNQVEIRYNLPMPSLSGIVADKIIVDTEGQMGPIQLQIPVLGVVK